VVDAMNRAQVERTAAKAVLDNLPANVRLVEAEVYAMIDSLGKFGSVLTTANPDRLAELYRRLDLAIRYEPAEQAAYVTASPRVDSECVRGGTRTPVRRTPATGRGSCAHRSVRSVRHDSYSIYKHICSGGAGDPIAGGCVSAPSASRSQLISLWCGSSPCKSHR
jgi:hypothetical protein